jgi:hypothetical protein
VYFSGVHLFFLYLSCCFAYLIYHLLHIQMCCCKANCPQDTRCDYEVPGMILLQAYLYTYSLLRGVTFEVLSFSSHALSPLILPLLGTFWNSCCGIALNAVTFFGCLQYPKVFISLKQTLFLETARSHFGARGIGWVFHFSN